MRIALIGAPESGKSDLAKKLAKKFKLEIIDDYVQELAKATNLYIGHGSTYIPNLLVTVERFKLEMLIPENRVTCGTGVDSMAYGVIYSSHVKEFESPDVQTIDATRATVILNSINFMLDETWMYDRVFYLPTLSESKMERELDYAIREVLATLGIDHTPLTDEDRFTQAVGVIGDDIETPKTSE